MTAELRLCAWHVVQVVVATHAYKDCCGIRYLDNGLKVGGQMADKTGRNRSNQ